MDDNKKRALAAALGQIERQFGKGAVMRMGDHERQAIPAISTGSLGLEHFPGGAAAPPQPPTARRPAKRPYRRDLRPGIVG